MCSKKSLLKNVFFFVYFFFFNDTATTEIYTLSLHDALPIYFESYTAGQNLVTQNPTDWDTWSGGGGTSEDVAVSNANASSGSNSLYFSGVPGGGPNDIILRFAQVYNSGNFSLDANFFVESGKGAYFNMQETFTVGGVWAIDCFMLDNGT